MPSDVFLPVGAVVPAMESFLAEDRFKRDLSDNAPVKIREVGANFQKWFGKLIVSVHKGSKLKLSTLARNASDTEIFTALGGEDKAETVLSEAWWLMTQQGRGQSGLLLNDGKANIFYAFDVNGVLRALYVFWFGSGWFVNAFEIDAGTRWSEDGRVFSRNSIPAA